MIDTGATLSAIFESAIDSLQLSNIERNNFRIHGMTAMGERPAAFLKQLNLGSKPYTNLPVAILEDRQDPVETQIKPLGIIGMDILSDFHIYVDGEAKMFHLIPNHLPSPMIPNQWRHVPLFGNPFIETDHNLHFINIRMGGYVMPALLDTGADVNLMNWVTSEYSVLNRAKRRLREEWEINGAIGTFDPVFKINAKNFRSGQKFWPLKEFIVMEFEGLDILGVKDQPFMIAGPDLLNGETFFLDFKNKSLRFKPTKLDRQPTYIDVGLVETDAPTIHMK